MRTTRLKLKRLYKQRRLLKNKERKLFNSSLAKIKEIKALKAQERLNQEIALVNPKAPVEAYTINQIGFQDLSPLETSREVISNL